MSYIGNEPIVSATRTVTEVTATAGQTVFNANGGYTVGYLDVFLNGSKLTTTDFTATNGSSITLTEAAQVGDIVRLEAWGTFSTSNLVSPNYTGTLTGSTGVVNIGSGQLYKDASGNVGIGTSSPNSNSFAKAVTLNGSSSAGYEINIAGTSIGYFGGDAGQIYARTTGALPLTFGTNSTERMRIDSVGVVTMGSSSTSNNTGSFSVNNTNTTADACIASFSTGTNSTATSNVYIKFGINNYSSAGGQINANGSGAAAFGSFSDRRLKENIVELSPQLDNILALKPVEFDYIESEGGGHQTGFIAQEMQDIYPDAVGERSDGMLTLTGWDKTTARLVKAIQEQQAIIQSQASTITAMELRLTALEVSSANASGTSVTQENK